MAQSSCQGARNLSLWKQIWAFFFPAPVYRKMKKKKVSKRALQNRETRRTMLLIIVVASFD